MSFSCYSPEQMLRLEADCSCKMVMTMMTDLKREKFEGEKKFTQSQDMLDYFFHYEAVQGTDF